MAKRSGSRGEQPRGWSRGDTPRAAKRDTRETGKPDAFATGRADSRKDGRKTSYSVHALAELSGVSVRTLHHYDAIGLLNPKRADNNYRVYGADEVDRLQQILLYREVGMSLSEIGHVLDGDAFDAERALEEHLVRLVEQRERTNTLIASVEKTLAAQKGITKMEDGEKFEGFKKKLVEENEKQYGREIREAYGDGAVEASNAKLMGMTEAQYQSVQDTETAMKEALLAGMEASDPAGVDAQRAAELHRQWLCAFWKDGTYSKDAHRGITEMYVADDRFKKYYEAIAPGAAEFLRDAVAVYCS
ncbi:MerR family transcriptional regulator [Raoultibacter massiliensis]|uniref:MerR family transcriptional regulator n=1 Tax=Raoultibacter massiliensis TaxID=1852371 RepID=UPI003A8D7194